MCVFTGPVELVADTRIFAAATQEGRQALVYSMAMESASEVAMVLPIPTPAGCAEDAVRFVALNEYSHFFQHCERCWPTSKSTLFGGASGQAEKPVPALAATKVGSYVASFVPSRADFARLDSRYRLPDESWNKLDYCSDWGFAVFQLQTGRRAFHPMAFEFPRRWTDRLFFPTVHLHDGKVHKLADFDHALYCQAPSDIGQQEWQVAPRKTHIYLNLAKTAGLVDPSLRLWRKPLIGRRANQDTWVSF